MHIEGKRSCACPLDTHSLTHTLTHSLNQTHTYTHKHTRTHINVHTNASPSTYMYRGSVIIKIIEQDPYLAVQQYHAPLCWLVPGGHYRLALGLPSAGWPCSCCHTYPIYAAATVAAAVPANQDSHPDLLCSLLTFLLRLSVSELVMIGMSARGPFFWATIFP